SSFGWCYVYFSPTATLNLVSNCWFHDWTNVNGPTQDVGFTCVLGDGPNNEVSQCEFDQSNVAEKSAVCCKNVAYVNFCHFHHTANAVLGYGIIHDNHFHDMSVTDPASHGNAIEVFGGAEIYNNLIHDNASEIAPIL